MDSKKGKTQLGSGKMSLYQKQKKKWSIPLTHSVFGKGRPGFSEVGKCGSSWASSISRKMETVNA